jgi:hypothetical protein
MKYCAARSWSASARVQSKERTHLRDRRHVYAVDRRHHHIPRRRILLAGRLVEHVLRAGVTELDEPRVRNWSITRSVCTCP